VAFRNFSDDSTFWLHVYPPRSAQRCWTSSRMNHSRNFSDWSRFFEYVTIEMPWPPSAAKRGLPPGPAGLAKKPVHLAFLCVAGMWWVGRCGEWVGIIAPG